MTKFAKKELFRQMEEALKDLNNMTIDDPGVSIDSQDMRHKNKQKYFEKLLKNYREKQIKKGSVDKPKL